MIFKLILAIFFGTLAGLIAGLISFGTPLSSLWEKTTIESSVAIGGHFTLVDTSGKERTEKDFIGKPTLFFFGFTHCPDVCPAGLQTLTIALNNLGEISNRLSMVFVTIDPERDTSESLTKYLQSFDSKIIGLSGNSQQIQEITKAYRVYAKKVPDRSETNKYTFDHSSFFYLMDEKGIYVKHFPSSIEAEKLTSELAFYLENLKPKI